MPGTGSKGSPGTPARNGSPARSGRAPSSRARPRLAFVTPLADGATAATSAALLPGLTKYYAVDVVTDAALPDDCPLHVTCAVRTLDWFDKNAGRYDRVLYHFGNSDHHRPMFGLLDRHPGTVILHDFALSGVLDRMDDEAPGALLNALYAAHGYRGVKDRLTATDGHAVAAVLARYPANLSVLQQANGVIVPTETYRSLADTGGCRASHPID